MTKHPLFLYELELPADQHWERRRLTPGAPAPRQWRQRLRRVSTKQRALRLLGACPEGTVLRRYRWFRPQDTYFLERLWRMEL